MAVTVLGTSFSGSATTTGYSVTTPSQVAVGTSTIIQVACGSNTDTSANTAPTEWLPDVRGNIGGLGIYTMGYTFGGAGVAAGVSSLVAANDQPSTAITGFGTVNSTNLARATAAATIGGGTIRATARWWDGSITSGTTEQVASSTAWTQVPVSGDAVGWSTTVNGCVAGDKLVVMLSTNRYNVSPIITAGTMTLTNITKVAEQQGGSSGQVTMQVWTADIGANQTVATLPKITITNPAGATGSYAGYMYAIKPTPAPDGGAGGQPPRIMVVGDSITAGSNFGSASAAQTNDRYIDLLFGNQTTKVGAITFASANTAKTSDTANAITWYDGSYTPYDGTPTTSVRVRNAGQRGWDVPLWIKGAWSTGNMGNSTDTGTKAPDVLVVNLGANDERMLTNGPNSPANLRDGIIAMGAAFSGATHIVLVKQWAWAYDYVTSSTFPNTRAAGYAHSDYHAAIDTAATQLTAAGKTVIVVDTGVDADNSGGTNVATPTNTYVAHASVRGSAGTVGSSGTVDNIHPSPTGYSAVWAPTLRTALDQIALLNPATGPSISVGGASAPTAALGRTPQLVKAGASTPAGSVSRNLAVLVAVAGAVAAVGSLLRGSAVARGGAMAGTGAPIKLTDKRSASGTTTPSATLTRIKALLRTVTGASVPSGALLRRPGPLRSGASVPTGASTRQTAKTTTGAATSAGARITSVRRLAAGATTPTGAIAAIKTVLLSLAGSVTATATLAAQKLTTLIQQSLTAALSTSSTLRRAVATTRTANVTPSATATRSTGKALAGAIAATGATVAEVVVLAALRILRRFRRPDFTRSARRESTQ